MKSSGILRVFDGFTVLCFVLLLGITYNRNSAIPPPYCQHCKTTLSTNHSCSLCIIYYWNGRKECYCCPHCAFPEKVRETKLGYQIQKMTVMDFETGKGINAFKSYYLVGSRLKTCCTPSIVAFHDFHQAQRYQSQYGGAITQWSN